MTWCLLQKRVITTMSIDGRVSDMVLITEKVITTMSIDGRVSDMVLISEKGYYQCQ